MAHKQVLFQSTAREKILRGATALTDALRVTLGPKSKSVLIGKKWGNPIVCNDGVTIAKEFDLKDPEENLGAQVIRQAADRLRGVICPPAPRAWRSSSRTPKAQAAAFVYKSIGSCAIASSSPFSP